MTRVAAPLQRGRAGAIVASALAVFAVAGVSLRGGSGRASAARNEAPSVELPRVATSVQAVAPAPTTLSFPAAPAALPPIPSSLAGTVVDGELIVDGRGHLVVSRQTKLFFDYFLVASGEEPDAVLRSRVEARVRDVVSPLASSEAMQLFDQYATFRLRAVLLPVREDADYEARVATIRALRREVLGEAHARAFFAADEELEDELVRRRAAGSAPAPSLHDTKTDTAASVVERDLALRRLPPDERRRARAAELGPEVAARLALLDDEDAVWERRLGAYRSERDAIRQDERRDDERRARALETLRARSFTQGERVRVEALDRIDEQRSRR